MWFRKKGGRLGYFVIVDWGIEAKRRGVGGEHLKKIYHMNNGFVFNMENGSEVVLNNLRRKGIIIIDRTKGQFMPEDAVNVPETGELLTKMQIKKMLP
jgi:hypothetical protein